MFFAASMLAFSIYTGRSIDGCNQSCSLLTSSLLAPLDVDLSSLVPEVPRSTEKAEMEERPLSLLSAAASSAVRSPYSQSRPEGNTNISASHHDLFAAVSSGMRSSTTSSTSKTALLRSSCQTNKTQPSSHGIPGLSGSYPSVSFHAQPVDHQDASSLYVRSSVDSSNAGDAPAGRAQGLRVEVDGGMSLAGGPIDEVEEVQHDILGARAEVLPPPYHRY